MDNNKIDQRAFQAETVYEQEMAGVVGAGPSMANEAASVAQGLAGWTIKRHEDGWIFFKRPDDFRQSVTPHEPMGSHAQTLHMLLDALLTQAASVAQLTDDQILSHAPVYVYNSDGYWAWQFSCDESLLGFARSLLAQAAPPAAPVQKCASCGQMPKALCCEVLAAPVAPASNHRPDRQWYESKIKETLNDDFEIGSVERSCGKCGRKLMRYELTCLHCKPMNTAPPADEASATIAGMRVVVDPRLAPCEFEIRASAQQDEPCGVCEETGYVAEDTRCPNCNPESAQQDERKCTCGSGPGGGHSRTCLMFDESMMRYDPFGLAAQQDEREARFCVACKDTHPVGKHTHSGVADFAESLGVSAAIHAVQSALQLCEPEDQAAFEVIVAALNRGQQVQAHAGEVASEQLSALLPGCYYMDPPDGGNVTLLEQLQRMAHDAGRYRWLRGQADGVVTSDQLQDIICGKWADEWDAAIDAAMSREQPQPSNGDREGGAV